MTAFNGDEELRACVLARMQAHEDADRFIRGSYWFSAGNEHRGCAIGCLAETAVTPHYECELRFGIPEELAWEVDDLFETLPFGVYQRWPMRFLNAVKAGSDLSFVMDRFTRWFSIIIHPVTAEEKANYLVSLLEEL